jgi:hypothetical protein
MRAQGQEQGRLSVLRAGSALAFVLVLLPLLGACTKGGQFDPTEVFNNDMFDAKKKLGGQREAVFPGGVPGTTTGVPADLVKGYQPPPDPSDADASQPQPGGGGAGPKTGAGGATAEAKPRPKPKPRPKVATAPTQAPAQSGDPIWNQTQQPPQRPPTRINVGAKPAAAAPAPAQDQGAASQPNWPSPSQQMTPAQQVQTNWPAPPQKTQ